MKNLTAFIVILATILIVVSLLLDKMLGIFMVSLGACLLLTIYDKSEKHKRL
jgi:4-hydroxybenzoate polyprenyltransferase